MKIVMRDLGKCPPEKVPPGIAVDEKRGAGVNSILLGLEVFCGIGALVLWAHFWIEVHLHSKSKFAPAFTFLMAFGVPVAILVACAHKWLWVSVP